MDALNKFIETSCVASFVLIVVMDALIKFRETSCAASFVLIVVIEAFNVAMDADWFEPIFTPPAKIVSIFDVLLSVCNRSVAILLLKSVILVLMTLIVGCRFSILPIPTD